MMKKNRKVNKIVSGGQSGVDRSALDFSIRYKIPHGGWCPKNRWAEDGQISDIYNLTETLEELHEVRTLKNIISSDGTLIIYRGNKDNGTLKTIDLCNQNKKTYIEIDLSKEVKKEEFNTWIKINQIKNLNIGGPRESNSPGIYKKTTLLLEYLFFD